MSLIEASTPKTTANISLIPDIAEDLPLANSTNDYSYPPKNLLTVNETSSTNPALNYYNQTTKSSIKALKYLPNKQR
ncbi:hypothetical protein QUA35_12130 [Microcoleus sp. N9_B2]|uniref:hypothetical protein n=1 Tax=unclassified Microcoleus TaxID=2642155 RepID=UPI002FD197C8